MSHQVELYSPAIGAAGKVVIHGHYGRPVLVFPAEGGSAWDYESNGMVGAVAGLVEGGRAKLYCVDAFDSGVVEPGVPLEERARPRRYESWIIDQVAPFIHDDMGGAQDIRRSAAASARSMPPTSRSGAPTCSPLAICMSGNYDPSRGTAGASAARPLLPQPDRLRRALHGDHLDWLRAGELPAGLRAGHVGGHDRRAGEHQAPRVAARREGDSARARPVGPRRPARLAVMARADRASSAAILLMGDETTHLIGLLLGTEEDWPTAFETLLGRLGPIKDASGTTHHVDVRADHDGAVRPARQAALRPRRRPAGLLVLPPARVAEEGRVDGRRVPAQQPVHVPVDGEARGILRDAAARAEGAADGAGPAQEPARQRALRLHGGQVQPAVRPRRRSPRASAIRCS